MSDTGQIAQGDRQPGAPPQRRRMPQYPTFLAVRVGQGDAFAGFSDDDFAFLVDGGRSTRFPTHSFDPALKAALPKRAPHVDVAVCTHNDADHRAGVLGMVSDGRVGELWLPGSWAYRLPDLLSSPTEVANELALEAVTAALEGKRPTIEDVAAPTDPRGSEGDEFSLYDLVEEAQSSWGRRTLASNGQTANEAFRKAVVASSPSPRDARFARKRFNLAINALQGIRKLAVEAASKGVQIRWWCYQENGTPSTLKGVAEPLCPVNSVECTPRRISLGALAYAAITISNRQSLVFEWRIDGNVPPVLLCADSDFSFKQPLPGCDGMLVTAPHHGSESNAAVYGEVERRACTEDILWVRSDQKEQRSRPCSEYLSRKRRFCTICNTRRVSQNVVAKVQNGSWTSVSQQCQCKCQ